MGRTFEQVTDGEEVLPAMQDYRLCCCDCGLVHRFDFTIVRKEDIQPDGSYIPVKVDDPMLQVQFVASRDNRSTATKRRWKRVKGWMGIA